jgi:putative transposase
MTTCKRVNIRLVKALRRYLVTNTKGTFKSLTEQPLDPKSFFTIVAALRVKLVEIKRVTQILVKKSSVRTSYQYRLNPTKEQASIMDNTLDMLRCQYNY